MDIPPWIRLRCEKMCPLNVTLLDTNHFFSKANCDKNYCFTVCWNYPPPSNSRHQDYSIFRWESLQTFICDCYWLGGRPKLSVSWIFLVSLLFGPSVSRWSQGATCLVIPSVFLRGASRWPRDNTSHPSCWCTCSILPGVFNCKATLRARFTCHAQVCYS